MILMRRVYLDLEGDIVFAMVAKGARASHCFQSKEMYAQSMPQFPREFDIIPTV